MALSNLQIKSIKPSNKVIPVNDGNGLYLHVQPNGAKYWKFRYKLNKKSNLISLGGYPALSIADARAICLKYRELLSLLPPVDPQQYIKKQNEDARKSSENSFKFWANEWFNHWKDSVSLRHANYTKRRIELDINPHIGHIALLELTKEDIKLAFQKCVDRNANDMARRVYDIIKAVLQYAVEHDNESMCKHNVANDIKFDSNVPKVKRKNFARIPISELPMLLRKIDIYQGDVKTRLALKIMTLTFVRTRELIEAKWNEIEWDNALWRIPKERMKSGVEHLVPLALQTIDLFKSLKLVTGHTDYFFPSRLGDRGKYPTMSNNTILGALENMGYKYQMTGHGFRGIARTQLGELDYPREWMEMQLSHLVGDETERAYNYAEHLKERRKMMQDWADYLDGIQVNS